MKKIEGIVRPHLLEAVKTALQDVGIVGLTVSEVKGFGRQKGQTETYRGSEYKVDFLPKIKVEVVVPDDLSEKVVAAFVSSARTGKFGDGKVFVTSLADVVRPHGRARRGGLVSWPRSRCQACRGRFPISFLLRTPPRCIPRTLLGRW